MRFFELLTVVITLLQREGRVSYRALKLEFALDEEHLDALRDELIYAKRLATDEDGRVLVWAGSRRSAAGATLAPATADFYIPTALVISFAPYAARGKACSGSSGFSTSSGVNRGMGTIPASCRVSRQAHTTSSWLGASFCLYHGR